MRFVAGRGAAAERLVRGTAVAERHREDVAYCGTAAAEPAGKGTAGTADCLLGRRGRARAQPWRSAIGKMLLAVAPPMRSLLAREPPAQRTAGRGADEAAARQRRWHRARAPLLGRGAGTKQELARGVRS